MNTRPLLLLLCAVCPASLAAQNSCQTASYPADLSLASRVDSAAFMGSINPSWFDGEQLALLLVRYDSLGEPSSARVHSRSHQGLHPQSDSIAAAYLNAVRPGVSERAGALVLSKGSGLAPYFSESLERCQPKIKNVREMQDRVTQALRRMEPEARRTMSRSGRFRASIWARVDTDGSVIETRIGQTSGNLAVDKAMYDAVSGGAEFEPGTIEGIPVSVWVRFPLTIRFTPPRTGG